MRYQPMPDYMGFPRARTIMDMLPEEITEADMAAIRRHAAKEKCGLREYRCPICGARFEAAAEYRYRLRKGKDERVYCSHKCYRVDEVKEAERFRREMMGDAAKTQKQIDIENAKRRLRRVREKMRLWQERRDAPEFDTLPAETKHRIRATVAKWQAQEVLAIEELEEVRRGA